MDADADVVVHVPCGTATLMQVQQADWLRQWPDRYAIPCVTCSKSHPPDVFPTTEFVWKTNSAPVSEKR